eukprot:scaffold256538_cov38-Prasinocladus_malaysianus.AAC.1
MGLYLYSALHSYDNMYLYTECIEYLHFRSYGLPKQLGGLSIAQQPSKEGGSFPGQCMLPTGTGRAASLENRGRDDSIRCSAARCRQQRGEGGAEHNGRQTETSAH